MNRYIQNFTAAVLTCFFMMGTALAPAHAQRIEKPIVGEMKFFAGNYAPVGWAYCDGQLLPISKFGRLFSVLGTTYGGDGRTTFGLPDMRGRIPMHAWAGSEQAVGTKTWGDRLNLDQGGAGPEATLALSCIIAIK